MCVDCMEAGLIWAARQARAAMAVDPTGRANVATHLSPQAVKAVFDTPLPTIDVDPPVVPAHLIGEPSNYPYAAAKAELPDEPIMRKDGGA